ncbi:MAG: tyrosine-type recombinase/integrase [Candidatus Rokubacteria bacterium]|nr:tyrosine-type recombinase/integrase [Candidatus Rokubacteria bacterium]
MKLSRAVQEFLADCLARGLARSTVEAYDGDLHALVALASPDSVLAFTQTVVRAYFVALVEKGLSPASLARKRAAVRAFGQWGRRQRLWTDDPTENLQRVTHPERLPRPFNPDETARLMRLDLAPLDRVVRALLYYTGLRVTPICQLTVADLSFAEVVFEDGTRFPGTIRSIGKGQKPLVTPMHPALKEVLFDWVLRQTDLKGHSWIISHRSGKLFTRRGIALMTHRWGRLTGVPDCTPHRFRHTFATDLLRQGTDVRVIQRLLSHANINTTMLYTRVTDQQASQAILKLPAWAPPSTGDEPKL